VTDYRVEDFHIIIICSPFVPIFSGPIEIEVPN
jgi:hypothetical protein